tara:strand:+ start:32665 stop:33111 length:447 start_codon:yes stop_codon:yes gene_type:complete
LIDDDGAVRRAGIVAGRAPRVADRDGDARGERELDLRPLPRVARVRHGGERRAREFARGTRVARGTTADDGDGVGVGVESVVAIVTDVGVAWDAAVAGERVESESTADAHDERGAGDGEDWVPSRRRRGERTRVGEAADRDASRRTRG